MITLMFFLALTLVTCAILVRKKMKEINSQFFQQKVNPLNPKEVIIAFDIHDVLFKLDYLKIPRVAVRSKHFYTLIKHALNPYVLSDIYSFWRKRTPSEKYFAHLTTQYPGLSECMPTFIQLVNTQQPIKPMIELLTNLKKQGYALHIFSNIGEQTIVELQQKFSDTFEHFEAIQVTSAEYDYQGKPHIPAFERYLMKHNPDKKSIIFIDDKKYNIVAARQHGITALQFKSFKKLKEDLQRLGVTL